MLYYIVNAKEIKKMGHDYDMVWCSEDWSIRTNSKENNDETKTEKKQVTQTKVMENTMRITIKDRKLRSALLLVFL